MQPTPLQSKEGRMFSHVLNFSQLPERVVGFGTCLHACWGKSPEATVHVIFQVSPPFSAICPSSFHSVLPRSHVSSQAMREDAFRVTRADGVSAYAVRQLQAVSEKRRVYLAEGTIRRFSSLVHHGLTAHARSSLSEPCRPIFISPNYPRTLGKWV